MARTDPKPLRLALFLATEVGMLFFMLGSFGWWSDDRAFDVIRVIARCTVLAFMAYVVYQCYLGHRSASWFCIILGVPQLVWALVGPVVLGLPFIAWPTAGFVVFSVACIALGITGLRSVRKAEQTSIET